MGPTKLISDSNTELFGIYRKLSPFFVTAVTLTCSKFSFTWWGSSGGFDPLTVPGLVLHSRRGQGKGWGHCIPILLSNLSLQWWWPKGCDTCRALWVGTAAAHPLHWGGEAELGDVGRTGKSLMDWAGVTLYEGWEQSQGSCTSRVCTLLLPKRGKRKGRRKEKGSLYSGSTLNSCCSPGCSSAHSYGREECSITCQSNCYPHTPHLAQVSLVGFFSSAKF